MSTYDSDYSADPLLNVNWDKTLRYPVQQHNIHPSHSSLVVAQDRLCTGTGKAPMMAAIHTVNLFLQAAWRIYEDKLKNNDPIAVAYKLKGEYFIDSQKAEGRAMYVNAHDDLQFLRYMSLRNILDSWFVMGVQMSGQTQSMASPSGPLVVAIHDSTRESVNYWGDVEMLEWVGFILTKRPNGSYAFVPYHGFKYPTPLEMSYEDVAGNLLCGVFIRIGQCQFGKLNEMRAIDESNQMLVAGLPVQADSKLIPTFEKIDARLAIHPKITLNVLTQMIDYH